ncbi:hypothetical protein WJX74_009058 [Apatococcus lobatus]|uniref:Methyltransferase type 11 domain-containing protein n=1 Tax=Apatococcus lobatus TaxID=904363 RepID=A0AAW1SG89_9CHLO
MSPWPITFCLLVCFVCACRQASADIQYWGKGQLGIDGSHLTDERSLSLQQHFDSLSELADHIFASTANAEVSANLLRQAFTLCPTCYLSKPGSWTHGIFYLDAYEDRKVLLEEILPAIYQLSPPPKRLLWIGVQPYTLRYEYLLNSHGIEMTTLEMDLAQALYGSSLHHIVGPVQDAAKHFEASSFDVVIINGVIGWGVDSAPDIEAAFQALYTVLKRRGLLVVGYNFPHAFAHWGKDLLPRFSDATLGHLPHKMDLGASELHHCYEFFRKAGGVRRHPPLAEGVARADLVAEAEQDIADKH